MSITINLGEKKLNFLHEPASLLIEIQRNRDMGGSLHSRSEEFDALTKTIQMHLGNVAFKQAIAETAK